MDEKTHINIERMKKSRDRIKENIWELENDIAKVKYNPLRNVAMNMRNAKKLRLERIQKDIVSYIQKHKKDKLIE